jgi:hypothetical protein
MQNLLSLHAPKCITTKVAFELNEHCRWEKARNSRGEEVTRPVIRMEQQGRPLIITRINPEFKSTSVLLRPRAGWRVLKDYLSGMEDVRAGAVRKQR